MSDKPASKKHKHEWMLGKSHDIVCQTCRQTEKFENDPIRILSLGVGVQTCYQLFKNPEKYDVVIFADVSNGDRDHGEYAITYWILDNLVIPFCNQHNIPLWILHHPDGGVYHRSLKEKKIPLMHPRWCTQDHKVTVIQKAIRNGLQANFPDNIVISDIGFSYDEAWRGDNKGSRVKYNVLDYPLINSHVKRKECVEWLNNNYPITMNGNAIDWKDCKSGCWFCPFWKKSKLMQLSDRQKLEMIAMEENTTYDKTFKNKPLKIVLGMDSHKMDEWTEEDEINDAQTCDSGYCMT